MGLPVRREAKQLLVLRLPPLPTWTGKRWRLRHRQRRQSACPVCRRRRPRHRFQRWCVVGRTRLSRGRDIFFPPNDDGQLSTAVSWVRLRRHSLLTACIVVFPSPLSTRSIMLRSPGCGRPVRDEAPRRLFYAHDISCTCIYFLRGVIPASLQSAIVIGMRYANMVPHVLRLFGIAYARWPGPPCRRVHACLARAAAAAAKDCCWRAPYHERVVAPTPGRVCVCVPRARQGAPPFHPP